MLKCAPRRLLEPARAAVSLSELHTYFDLLESTCKMYKFKAELIANFDETMLKVSDNGKRTVISKSSEVGFTQADAHALHYTMGVTIFADGTFMKPFVILPLRTMPKLDIQVLKVFDWAGQDSGWVTKEIFKSYADFFIAEVQRRRRASMYEDNEPALLLADGHTSRLSSETMQKFRDNNIVVIIPVAHSTHIIQPLDVYFLGIFKSRMSGCTALCASKTVPEKREALLRKSVNSFYSAATIPIISASFVKAGVFPLDRRVPLSEDVAPNEDSTPSEPPKKKARGCYINNQIATGTDVISRLKRSEIERKKKEMKNGTRVKRGRPKKVKNEVAEEEEEEEAS